MSVGEESPNVNGHRSHQPVANRVKHAYNIESKATGTYWVPQATVSAVNK